MDHQSNEYDEEPTSKRARIGNTDNTNSTVVDADLPPTLESYLSIPLSIIFRQVSSGLSSPKPLLSRSEAQSMIRINLIAQQMDVLIQMAFDAFAIRHTCKSMEPTFASHPILRSALPLFHFHGAIPPFIQDELSNLINELSTLSHGLQQNAEQNYTLSETLLDALGGTANELADSKRLLGELEEELCKRCNDLMTTESGTMEGFCEALFQRDQERIAKLGNTTVEINTKCTPTKAVHTKNIGSRAELLVDEPQTMETKAPSFPLPTGDVSPINHAEKQHNSINSREFEQVGQPLQDTREKSSSIVKSQNSQENRMTAALALIQGAKNCVLTEPDTLHGDTRRLIPLQSQFQAETNNALSSTTLSPPLIEPDDDEMVPDTQNAVYALTALVHGERNSNDN